VDARIVDRLENVHCRIDTYQCADALIGERAQQDAIVAADLDDRRQLRFLEEAGNDLGRIVPEMLPQRPNGRREVEIIAEENRRVVFFGDLDNIAIWAKANTERKLSLVLEVRLFQKASRQSDVTEIDDPGEDCPCRRMRN